MLADNFKEPSGFNWGTFKDTDNAAIRYGSVQPKGEVKGTMVIVTGFRETTEKYFEVINEMTAKGFAVWIMGWRGQGGSERFFKNDPKKMHMANDGYAAHARTLDKFVQSVVKNKEKPLVLSAHSMGAHIGIRYLSDYPKVFDAAVLTATMFDINTGQFLKPVARGMVAFAKASNILDSYIPHAKNALRDDADFNNNRVTSDIGRFNITRKIYADNPKLGMNGASYGWVNETFKSIDIVKSESYLKNIKTPLLIQLSGKDIVIDKKAQLRAVKLLPNCTVCSIPEAKYEIWMEREELRSQWLEKLNPFLDAQIKKKMHKITKNKKNNPHKPK